MMVLIVEDEALSRRALSSLLGSAGYTTVTADSGEEALRMVRSGAMPSFALVDLDLPGMSGIEFIPRLQHLRPGVTPVIISATRRERLEQAGDDLHVQILSKPVNLGELLDLLKNDKPVA